MVLRSRLVGSCSPALLSNIRRRKWRMGLGVARKRRLGWVVASHVVSSGSLCSTERTSLEGFSRLAALEDFFVRGRGQFGNGFASHARVSSVFHPSVECWANAGIGCS